MRRNTIWLLWAGLLLLLFPITVRAEPVPEEAHIHGLNGSAQSYSLSCEARSAVDWAAFWGVNIRERKFLSRLPRSDNPDAGFVGNPRGVWGNIPPNSYGVHAEPVAALLREYGLDVEARRGMTWDDLRAEIAAGRPVIAWVIGQVWRGTPINYTASDGHKTTVARFEHTVIVVGYGPTGVQVMDAYTGQVQTHPRRNFLASWKVLGNMAVVGRGKKQPLVTQLPLVTPLAATLTPQPTPLITPGVLKPGLQVRVYLPAVSGTRWAGEPLNEASVAGAADQPTTYRVKRGDYLAAVAKRLGVNWLELARANRIEYPYIIYTSQVLVVP